MPAVNQIHPPASPRRSSSPRACAVEHIAPGYAAIDIGAEHLFVASAHAPVRRYRTFTSEVRALCAWLREQGVSKVAMEATGVYWMPLYEALQSAGLEATLFNGAHARNLPGRKSDVQDCEWHAMLHSHGLLSACFVTPEAIRPLRTYARLRQAQVSRGAECVLHMQRALDQMNVRLHTVISQLHGVSGLAAVDAILAGEREPAKLLALCDARIRRTKAAEVLASLEGVWSEHHLFELRAAREAYAFCQEQIGRCDQQIEATLRTLAAASAAPSAPAKAAGAAKIKPMRHNAPQVEGLYENLRALCGGSDGQALPGLSSHSWMKLAAELGGDLSYWKSEKHFSAWCGLAPASAQSGKRRRRVGRRKTRVGQIFREAAMTLARTKDCALGGFYRRLRGKRGAPVAIVATARKLAVLYWRALTKGFAYVEAGLREYERQQKQQQERYLHKLAAKLGYALTPESQQLTTSVH